MVTVTAITCPSCKQTIYSRARHDYHSCECGDVFVDGGFDYLRYGRKDQVPEITKVKVNATKKELYDDWNRSIDKFGIIGG